jgi:hypothetical protein
MRVKIKKPLKKIKIRAHTPWPAAYRWAAVGTLVAYSAVGDKCNVAKAQALPRRPQTENSSQSSLPVRRYNIAAGMLEWVLVPFVEASGLAIKTAKDGMLAVHSPGVSGLYTADQALAKLLADTGLSYKFTSASTVSIDLKSVATSVDVTTNLDALAASSPKFSQSAWRRLKLLPPCRKR